MQMRRRSMLAACVGAVPALTLPVHAAEVKRDALGLVIHSFPVHAAADRARRTEKPLADPIRFLEHCRSLGANAVQVGLGAHDTTYINELRSKAEAASMHLECIVALPRDQADVDRLEAEVRAAKRCGATILRTVCLTGRRYETFD